MYVSLIDSSIPFSNIGRIEVGIVKNLASAQLSRRVTLVQN